MIWQVSFSDGRGGAFRVEWSADEDPAVPGNTGDSVRVLHRGPGVSEWKLQKDRMVHLRSSKEATLY